MFSMNTRVLPSRVDTNKIIKVTGIMDTLQDCSLFWLDSEPILKAYFEDNNVGLLLFYRQMDIVKRPSYGENIVVSTGLYGTRRAFGYRNTFIYDAQGNALVKTWCLGAFVDLKTHQMLKCPEEILRSIKIDEKKEMDYTDYKITIPEDLTFAKEETLQIKKSDIDLFGHTNNNKYIEKAMEFVDDSKISRLRVEFKKSALLHDTIIIEKAEIENKSWIRLNDPNGEAYALLECSV